MSIGSRRTERRGDSSTAARQRAGFNGSWVSLTYRLTAGAIRDDGALVSGLFMLLSSVVVLVGVMTAPFHTDGTVDQYNAKMDATTFFLRVATVLALLAIAAR